MTRRRRILFVLGAIVLSLTAVACGDDDTADDAEGAADASGAESTDADTADEADTGAETEGEDSEGGAVGASVTIDGQTYTATEQRVCVRLGGGLSAQFLDSDADISIDIDLPPEDWETDTTEDWDPPAVRVDVGDEAQLQSGRSDIVVGMPETAVTSYSIDGVHASGDGDFVDVFQAPADAVVVVGSFDVTCEAS